MLIPSRERNVNGGILGSKLETGNRRSEQNSAATSVKNKEHNVTDTGIEIEIENFERYSHSFRNLPVSSKLRPREVSGMVCFYYRLISPTDYVYKSNT